MMKITNKESGDIVIELIKVIQENKQYLSDIDGLIGDGDHGINMNKGFTMAQKAIDENPGSFMDNLMTLSNILMQDIGGSMGPLYGMFFRKMAVPLKKNEEINKEVFFSMIEKALDGIKSIGNAQVGDKTLVDALEPGVLSYKKEMENGSDFITCLDSMESAAKKGWESTKDMVAKLGRASRLGERSRGVLDAGATSCYLLIKTLSECIKEKLQ